MRVLSTSEWRPLAEAHAVISTKGVAACGEIPVIHLGGGVGYKWGEDFDVFRGCDLGPYSEARPEGIPDGFEVRFYTTESHREPPADGVLRIESP